MQNRKFLKKIKNKTTIWSNNPTSGYISKEIKIKILNRHLCFHVHCSIIHNSQDTETAQVPSMDEWIKKMWYLHTMEYYSAFKKKRRKFCHVQQHGRTWKAFMLSDIQARPKEQKLHDVTHTRNLKESNHRSRE